MGATLAATKTKTDQKAKNARFSILVFFLNLLIKPKMKSIKNHTLFTSGLFSVIFGLIIGHTGIHVVSPARYLLTDSS